MSKTMNFSEYFSSFPYLHDTQGHVWETYEDDKEVNTFAYQKGFHNGPVCVNCGMSFCEHCTDGIIPYPCPSAKERF